MASASQTRPQLSSRLGSLAGTICKWNPITKESSDPMTIYSRQEIIVGRDAAKCQYVIDNPYVSNQHLRIYTVIFDQDNPGEVAPLVYAQDLSRNGSLWNEHQMGSGQRSLLLCDGDTIRFPGGVYLRYHSMGFPQANSFTRSQELEMAMFGHEYTVTQRKLGSGAYGLVHMAYKKSTGQQFACKIVDLVAVKSRLEKQGEAEHEQGYGINISAKLRDNYAKMKLREKLEQYHREAGILEKLQHPNIIGLEKVIQSDNTIYMFQDLLTGGDLFSYIQHKGGRLPDIEAAVIVRQIVIALDYLHDQNIVHRDLKPDNILMTSRADGCRVVLTDFGCATLVNPISNRMSTMVGTYEFSAPEVVMQSDKGYTKAADLWSLGCLTAVVLTGMPLFENVPKGCGTKSHRMNAIKKLKWTMNRRQVGQRAQDFVFQLLQHDASERMDVKQALQHGWFTNPAHKLEFDKLYQRSIHDWKPRRATEPLIVGLASYAKARSSQSSQNLSPSNAGSNGLSQDSYIKSEPCSQWVGFSILSTAEPDGQQSSGLTHIPSATLSDIDLPPHKSITATYNPLLVSPNNADAFSVISSASQHDPLRNLTNSLTASSSSDSQRIQAPLSDAKHGARHHEINIMRGKSSHSDAGESDAEIFEEIRNPMTGKRQQLLYGVRI